MNKPTTDEDRDGRQALGFTLMLFRRSRSLTIHELCGLSGVSPASQGGIPSPHVGVPLPEEGNLDGGLSVWGEYSKDRYEWTEARIQEFRNWSRQLGAAISVLVGLEVTVIVKVLFDLEEELHGWHAAGIGLLLFATATQVIMLSGNILAGYAGEPVRCPTNPIALRSILARMSKSEAEEVIGRYYANGYADNNRLQQKLAKRLGWNARLLMASLLLFVLGIASIVVDVNGYHGSHVSKVGKAAPAPLHGAPTFAATSTKDSDRAAARRETMTTMRK
jgi:hypothetical protein